MLMRETAGTDSRRRCRTESSAILNLCGCQKNCFDNQVSKFIEYLVIEDFSNQFQEFSPKVPWSVSVQSDKNQNNV